jgi:hypothetical protein
MVMKTSEAFFKSRGKNRPDEEDLNYFISEALKKYGTKRTQPGAVKDDALAFLRDKEAWYGTKSSTFVRCEKQIQGKGWTATKV